MTFIYEATAWMTLSVWLMAFSEYVIHRWFMHKKLWKWSHGFYMRHAILHHRDGDNSDNIDLPVGFALLTAIPVFAALWWSFGVIAPICFAVVVAVHARVWTRLHRAYHDLENNWTEKLWCYESLKVHHLRHHDKPNRNYGAVFPWIDIPFRTVTLHPRDPNHAT